MIFLWLKFQYCAIISKTEGDDVEKYSSNSCRAVVQR